MSGVATTIAIADELEIPLSVRSLGKFRKWSRSDEFPEHGRIDYISGRIEVDMAPEDAWFHSAPKSELIAVLHGTLKNRRLGTVFSDSMRLASPDADLSCEPDLILVFHQSLKSGKVVLVPKSRSNGRKDRYVEIQGAPELVVEIISDSSVKKDTQRLPPAYFAAGVDEFWLVDVRPESFLFQIHRRGKVKWKPAATRPDGSQHSTVLDRWYHLEQHAEPGGVWTYDLIEME